MPSGPSETNQLGRGQLEVTRHPFRRALRPRPKRVAAQARPAPLEHSLSIVSLSGHLRER